MKECCETEVPREKRYWHWVVLAAVVLLAMALQMIPQQIGHHYLGGSTKAKADLVAFRTALDEYAINNQSKYPSSLQPLVTADTNGNAYLEGYNNKVPLDPWKHPYQYEPPTTEHPEPRIWSFGADGKRGGTGDDADIDSDSVAKEVR